MKNIILLISFLTLLFAQYEIEGRWHLVGYEDLVMYEFVDTEPFADAGWRYTLYSIDGNFGDLDDAGGSPSPYSIVDDIITIDLFFGNIVSYRVDYRCDGQVVDFVYIPEEIIHSTLFREDFDYFNSECFENSNECSLTTDDILGPYYFEDAPFRSVIAHENEPGQRLFISGIVKQNDCEHSISGSLIELWQANDEGCYGIVEDCDTGNPENDYFNLRGKFFSDSNGNYSFESILPGYYGSRPRHIHIKITTPNGQVLVSQLYFENDPYCENDQWCQDANDRIISLQENEFGLYGTMNLIMNSVEDGIVLGDLNFDSLINILDVVSLVGIIIDGSTLDDFQVYAGDLNNDNILNVLDIIQLVNIILN